jgi:tetratricopeptide (TPR) repeat protein
LGSPFALLTDVIEIRRKLLGENHEETATAYNNLAVLLLKDRKYDEAAESFNKALEIRRKAIGEEKPQTIKSYYALGKVYLQQNKFKPAEQLFENALKLLEKLVTGDPTSLTDGTQDLTDVYESVDLFPKPEPGVRGMPSFEDLIDIGGFNITDFAGTYTKLLELQNRSSEIDQVRKRFQLVSEKIK